MNELEFLPERIIQQRARRGRLTRQGYLLAVCLAAMAALTVLQEGKIATARADLSSLALRLDERQRQVAQIPPVERQIADLMIKKRIDEELGSQVDCTTLLAEFCRLMPRNVSLVSMDLKTVEMNAQDASASARGKGAPAVRRFRLVITGLAPTDVDVANFIGQISASPLFEDVNMGYTRPVVFRQGRSVASPRDAEPQRNAREFQASCYLVR
jgi:Tfp pilus assembly protein PilN